MLPAELPSFLRPYQSGGAQDGREGLRSALFNFYVICEEWVLSIPVPAKWEREMFGIFWKTEDMCYSGLLFR